MTPCKDCGHPLENHNVGSFKDRCASCACYAPTDRADLHEAAILRGIGKEDWGPTTEEINAIRRAALEEAKGVVEDAIGQMKSIGDQIPPHVWREDAKIVARAALEKLIEH